MLALWQLSYAQDELAPFNDKIELSLDSVTRPLYDSSEPHKKHLTLGIPNPRFSQEAQDKEEEDWKVWDDEDRAMPFPRMANGNLVGRLFSYSTDLYPHRVRLGTHIKGSVEGSINYSPHLRSAETVRNDVNSYGEGSPLSQHLNFEVALSHGFVLVPLGIKMEVGAAVQSYMDLHSRNNPLLKITDVVHQDIFHSPDHIPHHSVQNRGVVGNRDLTGKNSIKIVYALVNVKAQILEERGWIPDMAITLSYRFPLAANGVATQGVGATVGLSKTLIEDHLNLIASYSVSYQNYDSADFHDQNIRVFPWAQRGFVGVQGIIKDLFSNFDGGITTGLAYSNKILEYKDNPKLKNAAVIHGMIFIQDHNTMIGLGIDEDILAQEINRDDFSVYLVIDYKF